jgi:MFS family permease
MSHFDPGDQPDSFSLTALRKKFALLSNRNFRLLWISSLIVMLGDYFMFVAMPFLVMLLTDDRAAIGGVMAVGGIPRAIFILFGGVFSDRFSPLVMMKYSRVLFGVMMIGMSALIISEDVTLWMLYIFSVVMGTIGAFGMPAQMAILPRLVGREDLGPANALTGGTSQLISAIAPALAGVAVLYLSTGPLNSILSGVWPAVADLPKRADLHGIGIAYAIDSITIFLSMYALWAIKLDENEDSRMPAQQGILASITEGFAYVWSDTALRAFIIYMAVTMFISMGPQSVGMPVLADDRLEGMRAFGLMMSASGIGAVLGSLIAGVLTPSNRALGTMMMLFAVARGVATLLIAFIESSLQGMVLMAIMGLLMGYSSIIFMTWIQSRVQLEFLGRVMSLVMLSVMGLQPLSLAFSGWFIDVVGLSALFIGVGIFMSLAAALALLSRDIRRMGEPPVRSLAGT